MRISKLNKDRLVEVRRRKYLNELFDFCLYESCLQEETATDYFAWLINQGLNQVNWDEKNSYKKNSDIDVANTDRFNAELNRLEATDDYDEKGYFEGNTFAEFRKEFKRNLRNQKANFSKSELSQILNMFDLYCSRFVKNLDGLKREYEKITPTFAQSANWKGIKSTTSL